MNILPSKIRYLILTFEWGGIFSHFKCYEKYSNHGENFFKFAIYIYVY